MIENEPKSESRPDSGPWRLFVALPLPADVGRVVQDAQARLNEQRLPLRWTNHELAHMTLKFLGDTPAAKVDALTTRLNDAVRAHAATELVTHQLGAFPSTRAPHVVWVGTEGDVAGVQALVEAVDTTAAAFGFDIEKRVYRPHITLGRWRYNVRSPFDITDILRDTQVEAVALPVERVQLIRSVLRGTGPEYTVIAEWPLAR